MLIYTLMIESPEDQSKFEQLYVTYRGLMLKVADDILNDSYEAEDAVHQAFLKVAERINEIGDPLSPRTKGFLVTIVENKAIDIYRRNRRHPQLEYEDACRGMAIDYSGANILTTCIAKLQPRYREMILLKYYHGYETREIARIMGITESNASKLDQRAKKKLLEMCKEEGLV